MFCKAGAGVRTCSGLFLTQNEERNRMSSGKISNHKIGRLIAAILFIIGCLTAPAQAEDNPRQLLLKAILAPEAETISAISALSGLEDDAIVPTLEAWRAGELYIYATEAGPIPFTVSGDGNARMVETGELLTAPDGTPVTAEGLTPLDTSARIRRAMRTVTEVAGVVHTDASVRLSSIRNLGQSRNTEYLGIMEKRLITEKDPAVQKELDTAVAMLKLESADEHVRIEATKHLGKAHSLAAAGRFKEKLAAAKAGTLTISDEERHATVRALSWTIGHWERVTFFGNVFRGLSSGSVLLITALGLAITFGLMGVINMAHGEIMVVGAYACYLTQKFFIGWFGNTGTAFDMYFIAALPVAFVSAALMGLLLERTVIQFLYKRPLESLLATWGVSLVLQQAFRIVFGPANVQINAPSYLMGNFVWMDIIFAWNRVFIILFAAAIVFGVWLLLTRTSAGLIVRAVMQNRQMASCMGVRTRRVNMITFAFGSGLAGLAGACLAQLGNVGPGLGQLHIIDSFMVVVSGGVGNILGTIVAALGIGTIDQTLQPVLGPVMGKILVLFAIILFLQRRPGGLFPTKSRSLD